LIISNFFSLIYSDWIQYICTLEKKQLQKHRFLGVFKIWSYVREKAYYSFHSYCEI